MAKRRKTQNSSEQYWPKPVAPPEGAPNVLAWLIDDMGFGHASPIAGPFDRWPSGDGWEHFYGFMSGDMNNFNPIMWMDHTPMQPNDDKPGHHMNKDVYAVPFRCEALQKLTVKRSDD